MIQFLRQLQTERSRLISKIRMTVRIHESGKGDTIGCGDADAVLRVIAADLAKHSVWIARNEPKP